MASLLTSPRRRCWTSDISKIKNVSPGFFLFLVAFCGLTLRRKHNLFVYYLQVIISALIIKITISSLVIGLKMSYFPLIRLPSCYRTVCYRTVCYWIVCYWKVVIGQFNKANHIQRCSLNQPIIFKVVIKCACARACFCVFAGNLDCLRLLCQYFTANFPLFS